MFRKPPEAIVAYLKRLDAYLSKTVDLVIIGGTAIALRWSPQHATSDIDVYGALPDELQQAIHAAGAEGKVPIHPVGVLIAPVEFETRLQRQEMAGLTWLRVFLPEAHDLAIMKMARGGAHDLDAIEEMHRVEPLALVALMERYRSTDYIGKESDFRWALLATVERLFGSDVAEETRRILQQGCEGTATP